MLRSELQSFVDAKAKTKHGAEISTRKKEKQKGRRDSKPNLVLDPRQLELDVARFKDADGDLLEQIPLDAVKADARGIALCTTSEAMPFIVDHKSLSADALALLTIEDIPTQDRGRAPIESLRFPAVLLPTKDPLLVQGCLLQLGDVEVHRDQHEVDMSALDVGDTQVLKVQLFRDEITKDWQLVTESPIRFLFTKIPLFRLCALLRCDRKCGQFHQTVEEPLDAVVHEVWARRFQSIEGRVLNAERADVFQVFLRVAAAAASDILRTLVDGIYIEPRSNSAKATDSDFAVVWLPGANREAALHKLKLVTQGLSLVRMKHRFGIRVMATNEVAVYQALRPGENFLKVHVKFVFKLHPLPHGLQRSQVVTLLKDWGWNAKPLQPVKGTADGGAWEVGSSARPPRPVMLAFSQDVLISLVTEKTDEAPAPPVICPRRVQQHLKTQVASSSTSGPMMTDPWLKSDPWLQYRSLAQTAPTTAAAQTRLDSITESLKADLAASVQEQLAARNSEVLAGDTSLATFQQSQNDRLSKLEVGFKELQAHGQQMTHWCEGAATRMTAQEEQLSTLQTGLAQTQQDLQLVRTEVHSSAEHLQQSMVASFGAFKTEVTSELTNSFSQHMDRFERLLTDKQQRREG